MAGLAGLLFAGAFSPFEIAGLAWVAPALLLTVTAGQRGAVAFRLGYVAGAVRWLVSLYWLLLIPFPAGAVAGWLALCAYLALYPALWVWLCWRCLPFTGESGDASQPDSMETGVVRPAPRNAGGAPDAAAGGGLSPERMFQRMDAVGWLRRGGWALGCAVLWVALEMVQARLASGFPWSLLGVSQHAILPLVQVASIAGVHGIAFLVVWFSVALFCAAARLWGRPATHRDAWAEILVPLLVVIMTGVWGYSRMMRPLPERGTARLALIQPSVPQTLIFDPTETTNRFDRLVELSEEALESGPDVLIWPEAAMPPWNQDRAKRVFELARAHGVWLVLGADDVEEREDGELDFYNSAFLISPDGRVEGVYRKRRLVIFGEYVPLDDWIPFMRHLTPIPGGFEAGDKPVPFRLEGTGVETSVLICFEDVFPRSARGHVLEGTDFLLNLTNDGWFRRSAAHWQHAYNAVFRAVENGVPLVRCTNNGLTCWIDARGRIREVFRTEGEGIYGAGFLITTIPLPERGAALERPFYHRYGDVFGWSCVGIGAWIAGVGFMKRKGRHLLPGER
jgi:apolipoprotein N-acyltransferase